MTENCATTNCPIGRHAQRATRIAFFIAGFGMAAWAPLVPYAKARAGLDEGLLGLLLLCLGAGSIIAMPLAGVLASRVGCRRVLIAATVGICLTLPVLAAGSSPALLAAALFAFGASVGSVDCTVNIQAVIVERASGRTMMSGFHGLFSLGGILGAAGVSAFLSVGGTPVQATLCVAMVIVIAIVLAAKDLLPYGGEQSGPAFAVPHGIVLLIGILCFIVFLTEGAALDWSAVFLTQLRGMAPTHAGAGYAVFAAAMTLGRLTGDTVVRRLGHSRVVTAGGLSAAAGLVLLCQ